MHADPANREDTVLHWSLEQRVSVGFALICVILAGSFGIAYHNTSALIDANTWVVHTHEVLAALAATEGELSDAQTGMQGFVITGEDTFLVPYRTGRADLSLQLKSLRALTTDNATQQARITLL